MPSRGSRPKTPRSAVGAPDPRGPDSWPYQGPTRVLGYDVEFPGQPWGPHHPPALQDRRGFRSAEAAAHWATKQLRHERRRVLMAQLSETKELHAWVEARNDPRLTRRLLHRLLRRHRPEITSRWSPLEQQALVIRRFAKPERGESPEDDVVRRIRIE